MGTIQHTAVLFVEQDDQRPICAFYEQVCKREPLNAPDGTSSLGSLVTPLMCGFNAYRSFAIMPHGSSLGREHDVEMREFREWARQLAASLKIESVVVSWGDNGLHAYDDEVDAVMDATAVPVSPRALGCGLEAIDALDPVRVFAALGVPNEVLFGKAPGGFGQGNP